MGLSSLARMVGGLWFCATLPLSCQLAYVQYHGVVVWLRGNKHKGLFVSSLACEDFQCEGLES